MNIMGNSVYTHQMPTPSDLDSKW